MKISYLITCSTETETLQRLLERVVPVIGENNDEMILVVDSDISGNEETLNIIKFFDINPLFHNLDKNYGAHKNWSNQQCSGDWIMQIDGDELPSEYTLGENLHSLLESNSEVELIFVPRMNDYVGVHQEIAKHWGWRLTPSKHEVHKRELDRSSEEYKFLNEGGYIISEKDNLITHRAVLVNYPDYQGRVYRNIPDRIKWDRRLHEKIEGHTKYSLLPSDEEYAMIHFKPISKQWDTNKRYNKWFSQEENMGHKVF